MLVLKKVNHMPQVQLIMSVLLTQLGRNKLTIILRINNRNLLKLYDAVHVKEGEVYDKKSLSLMYTVFF